MIILLEGEDRTLCISCHLLWRQKHYWRLNATYSKKYYQFFMFNMITTKYAFHFNSLWIPSHCTTTIHRKGFLWGHFVMTCSQSGEHPKDLFFEFAHIQDMKAKIFKHSFYKFGYLLWTMYWIMKQNSLICCQLFISNSYLIVEILLTKKTSNFIVFFCFPM